MRIRTHLFRRGFFVALFIGTLSKLHAQGTFTVISTNDGCGQFGWTFSSTSGSYPVVDHFQMKLYGVQETFSPQGWTGTIDANEVVTWSFLAGSGGTPFTGSPLAFSIRSTSTQSIAYGGIGNTLYPDGLYSGSSVFGRFTYDGPLQVPEPSEAVLWMVAAATAVGVHRKYFTAAKFASTN